jgi:hypothetical protein
VTTPTHSGSSDPPADPAATQPAPAGLSRPAPGSAFRTALASRSAGWIVAAALGGSLVTLIITSAAEPGGTVQLIGGSLPAPFVHARGYAGSSARIVALPGSPAMIHGQVSWVPGPMAAGPGLCGPAAMGGPGGWTISLAPGAKVPAGGPAQQRVTLFGPGGAIVIRRGNTVRVIRPPFAFRQVITGPGARRLVFIGLGAGREAFIGPGAGREVFIGPGARRQVIAGPAGSCTVIFPGTATCKVVSRKGGKRMVTEVTPAQVRVRLKGKPGPNVACLARPGTLVPAPAGK